METMHPVVLRGRTGGLVRALPPRESSERIEALQAAAAAADLVGAAVYGDARDYAPLCYITGYIPMLRWAVALVPAAGKPSLYLAGPTRDLSFIRALTWIEDIHPVSELADGLAALASSGRVGLVGAQRMRASIRRQLAASAELAEADELLAARLWTPRPSELALLREADRLTRTVADLAEAEYTTGAGATEALLAAERAAREQGAHDVRGLYSPDSGRTLWPFETVVEGRPRPYVFYLAVELDGYWGEALRTVQAPAEAQQAVGELLDAVARELQPGVRAADVVSRLGRLTAGLQPHPVVSGRRAVARLGLGRDDRFASEANAVLTPGVYSLRAGALSGEVGVLRSTTIELGLGEADT